MTIRSLVTSQRKGKYNVHSKQRQEKKSTELSILSKFFQEALKKNDTNRTVVNPEKCTGPMETQASAPVEYPPPYTPLEGRLK